MAEDWSSGMGKGTRHKVRTRLYTMVEDLSAGMGQRTRHQARTRLYKTLSWLRICQQAWYKRPGTG